MTGYATRVNQHHPLNLTYETYLFDTAPMAAYLQKKEPAVSLIRTLIEKHEVATSIVVFAEVTEYIRSHPKFTQRHYELRQLLREIYPYFLPYLIHDRYADIKRKIRPPYGKGLIGDMDTLIATTALERHLTILTTDNDFARVPKLNFQLVNLKAA